MGHDLNCKIVQRNPHFRKSRDSKLIWKDIIYLSFKQKYHIILLNVGPIFADKTADLSRQGLHKTSEGMLW